MSQSDFVAKGQALVNSGQFQEAVKVCRLGLLGRPTTVEGRVVLGQALLALKRYDEVLAEMRVALELDRGSFSALQLKGEALLRKGDPHAAIEIFRKLQHIAPSDPNIDNLLAECERELGKPSTSASHPSVSYLGKGSSTFDENTRHYPNHAFGAEPDEETTGGSFDQPTAIAAPSSKKKNGPPSSGDWVVPASSLGAMPDATPPPNVLAVGDKSGTVEVDPELEGVELGESDDFGEVVAPPTAGMKAPARAALPRGQVVPAAKQPGFERVSKTIRREVSSVELLEDDLVEVEPSDSGEESVETLSPISRNKPGARTHVRNQVNVPSGPLDIGNNPAANRPTEIAPAVPQHLVQAIANAPHVVEMRPANLTMRGNAPGPGGFGPGPIAAAQPTVLAAQPPLPANLPINHAAYGLAGPPLPAMPAAPLPPPPQGRPANAPDQPWARATVAAVPVPQVPAHQQPSPYADEPTQRPHQIDPQIAAMLQQVQIEPAGAIASVVEGSQSNARVLKTGMRKGRSKLQIAVWLIIGGLVIAGGVIIGFKFRAMRLDKKIADTQGVAIGLAKSDTWKGMVRSRDRLAGIAQAADTTANKAALARMRALIAFEFGEGVPEAKTAIDALGGQGGVDAEIATAYHALATGDVKVAREASSRALTLAPDDAAALYVTGQAELLAGELTAAVKQLEAAVAKEGRPLYRVALARAHLEATDYRAAAAAIEPAAIKKWYDSLDAETTKELQDAGLDIGSITIEHPSVVIQRVRLAVASGQVGTKAGDLRGTLDRITKEAAKDINDQPRGISLVQQGFAYLALAEIDLATSRPAQPSINAALNLKIDDQQFAEQASETLYLTFNLTGAMSAAERTLKGWPSSRRARLILIRVALQQGRAQDAIDLLAKLDNADKQPVPLSLRGRAKLALGDLEGAAKDLDRAYELSGSKLEPAVVARAWVDLANRDLDGARKRLDTRFKDNPTAAVVTVWAAILRASGTADDVKKAKELLEPIAAGSPSIDVARAQLELARLDREIGDDGAKALYAKVIAATGSREVQAETARYLIDYSDDNGGREMFDELLKGDPRDPPELLIEAARAHLLVGDHTGGADLIDRAAKAGIKSFKLDRERGRLALRKGDYAGAVDKLTAALDQSGDDLDTLFLAAEVASTDTTKYKDLGDKIKAMAKSRLKEGPAQQIVFGKLAVQQSKDDPAQVAAKAFKSASDTMQKAAPPRLRAQAALGVALVAYNLQDDPVALDALALAVRLDPTLYEAYIYEADIQIGKKDFAKGLERAQLATKYNPDNADGYMMVGRAAHGAKNRKLLNEMIVKLTALAPNSDQLKLLRELN